MKIDLSRDSIAMFVVCHALGTDTPLVNQMKVEEPGVYDIHLTCGGVELDFSKVCKRLDECFDQAVEKRAGEMYLERYDRRADEITEELQKIGERLKEIRSMKFPEITWND